MYRLLEWAFAYDDGSGLPDAGAYAAELKNVTATADGKPVQGFDPTKTGTWTIPAGTQVNIVDMPDDWKLDGKAEQPAGTVVFTASKYGTPVVTWTFKNDSATDPDKPADPGTDASTTNVVKMGSQKTVTRMTISTMFKIKPTRFPSTDLSFLKRCTPMQTSRIMNANPVSRKNQYQGFPAVAKARSIRDPFMTSYWECSQCL